MEPEKSLGFQYGVVEVIQGSRVDLDTVVSQAIRESLDSVFLDQQEHLGSAENRVTVGLLDRKDCREYPVTLELEVVEEPEMDIFLRDGNQPSNKEASHSNLNKH